MFVGNRQKRTVLLSLLACVAFIALAVWSWGVAFDDVLRFFWLSLLLLAIVIIGAGLLVFVLKFARMILQRNNSTPNDQP